MTSKEAMGLLEILQLIMTHPNIRDYADEDLKQIVGLTNNYGT